MDFYRTKINTSNQQDLFKMVKSLSSPTGSSALPTTDSPVQLAQRFADFFSQKITKLRVKLELATCGDLSIDLVDQCQSQLDDFHDVCEEDVKSVIISSSSSTCGLDPLPTKLAKKCLNELLTVITALVNASLSSGVMPRQFKKAIVTPILKKAGSSREALKNYRPVANLNFVGKVIEKVATMQIVEYLSNNNLHVPTQSAYKQHHSVETALTRVQNDVILSLDQREEALLVLLDFTSAFDTIDHDIMLTRSARRYGFGGCVQNWLKSYLSGRSHVVKIENNFSCSVPDECGVPQGSVMGPILFSLYSAPIYDIIQAHGLSSMIYADDVQVYLTFPISDRETAVQRINKCITDIISWSIQNKLIINASKTEVLHFMSKFAPTPPHALVVSVDGVDIAAATKVRNLGVIMNKHLSMSDHVTKTCQSAIISIRKIGQIRQYLDRKSIETLVHALIMSHVDNCNVLYYGIPKKEMNRLQRIQNTAARLVTGARLRDPITPILCKLHWLPVEKRIIFKILIMCFKAMNNLSPSYITELIHQHTPARSLRSSLQNLLTVQSVKTQTYGNRAFSASAPVLWNSLPTEIRKIPSFALFKTVLKTHLFSQM